MRKILITIISLFAVLQISAQDKEYTIKPRTIDYEITKDGEIFIIKKEKKEFFLMRLDKNFEQKFNILLPKKKAKKGNIRDLFFSNDLQVTEDGKHLFWGNWLIDKNGKMKEYFFGKEESRNINPVFDFLTNKYYTYIGPNKGRKNVKKKYERGDIHILSRKHEDFSEVENILEEAVLDSNFDKDEVIEWSLGEKFDDYFHMLTRDNINEERNIDSYHIVSYDYAGKIKDYKKLTVKLKRGHFVLSRANGPAFAHDFSFGLPLAPSGIYTDTKKGAYYIYGFFIDELVRNMNAGVYKGFYVHKFNNEGELLWRKDYLFDSILFDRKHLAIQTDIDLKKINDNEIIIRASHERGRKGFLLFRINSEEGKLIKAQDIDFKNSKIPMESDIESSSNFENKKIFPKISFDYDALTAIYLNPEIYKFIKRIKKEVGIDGVFLDDGSVIIYYREGNGKRYRDYRKDSIKMFKFNMKD